MYIEPIATKLYNGIMFLGNVVENKLGITRCVNSNFSETEIKTNTKSMLMYAASASALVAGASCSTTLGSTACVASGVLMATKGYTNSKSLERMQAIENRANKALKPNIQVVGLGLSRTGTVSLWEALGSLANLDTWHGLDCFTDPVAMGCWEKFEYTGDLKYLYAALEGKTAAIEFPVYRYPKIMYREFPNAKYILTTRNEAGWAKSVKDNLFVDSDKSKAPVVRFLAQFSDKFNAASQFGKLWESQVENGLFEGEVKNTEIMEKAMEKHTSEIKKIIPEANLLIIPIEDANELKYNKLCEFLTLNKKDGDSYKTTNDGASIRKTAERVIKGLSFDRTGKAYKNDS